MQHASFSCKGRAETAHAVSCTIMQKKHHLPPSLLVTTRSLPSHDHLKLVCVAMICRSLIGVAFFSGLDADGHPQGDANWAGFCSKVGLRCSGHTSSCSGGMRCRWRHRTGEGTGCTASTGLRIIVVIHAVDKSPSTAQVVADHLGYGVKTGIPYITANKPAGAAPPDMEKEYKNLKHQVPVLGIHWPECALVITIVEARVLPCILTRGSRSLPMPA